MDKQTKDIVAGAGAGALAGSLMLGVGMIPMAVIGAAGMGVAHRLGWSFTDKMSSGLGSKATDNALAGAGIGAVVGSIVPIGGTILGAAVGGVGGAAATIGGETAGAHVPNVLAQIKGKLAEVRSLASHDETAPAKDTKRSL